MAVYTSISEAKCKHCKFAESYYPLKINGQQGKVKRTKCSNPKTQIKNIRMNDSVCDKWELN